MKVRMWEKLRKLYKYQQRLLDAVDSLAIQVDELMATQAELAEQVKAVGNQLTKIGTETSALLAKVEELKVLANNASPELQAAVAAVAQQAQVVDDLVPDVPPAP